MPTIRELREKAAIDVSLLTPEEFKKLEGVNKSIKARKAREDERWMCDRKEAAQIMECTIANIDKLTKEGKLKKNDKGKIDIRSICSHLKEYRDKRGSKTTSDSSYAGDEAKRFRKIKDDIAEIELKKKMGDLIEWETVMTQISTACEMLKTNLLELPKRLPATLAGKDERGAAVVLTKEIKKILEVVREDLRKAAVNDAGKKSA